MSRGVVGLALAVALGLAIAAGCGAAPPRMTIVQQRAASIQVDLTRLPANTRAALDRGEVWIGATEPEAFIARGEPRLWWNTYAGGKWCRVLLHNSAVNPLSTDVSVTTCDGVVVAVAPIAPALPCWRLADVGPRIVKAADYFDRLALHRQWQIVAGILERGQASAEIDLAFGSPYSRGFDEREDGKRADQLVFLDHGANAYGLNITLIQDRVVAWRMPAERRLTPEAEQRRLDAMEQRLTAKIKELEEITKRQHEETVNLFNDVMEQKASFLSSLVEPLVAVTGAAAGAAVSGGIAGSEVEETAESSEVETGSGEASITRKDGTTTIKVDESRSKETRSKKVRKRKK